MVKIACMGDIHSPIYIPEISKHVKTTCEGNIKLFLLAGDIVERGRYLEANIVKKAFKPCLDNGVKIISVFGNDDFIQVQENIKRILNEFFWLEDESIQIELGDVLLNIFGTTGCIDELTSWQKKNLPWLKDVFEERISKLEEFLRRPKRPNETRILLTHYPPTYKTLVGEPRFAWSQMGCRKMEQAILKHGSLDYVIHAHAHKSVRLEDKIGNTLVVNVSFPARKTIYVLNVESRLGLLKFFG